MDILFAVIGVLIGGSLGYWWRGRTVERPLPRAAVWLFPVKGKENLWRVEFKKKHNWMEPEPTLWILPQHEHSFALQEKHALHCKEGEFVDLRCVFQVTPKRSVETLESLLAKGSIEQLNDVSWVFQTLQSTLKTSTTILKQETREYWLSNSDDLIKRWQARLDGSLPHWQCTVEIEHLSATSDMFYKMTDPVQRALLLSRIEQKEDLEAIEGRLKLIDRRMEEEKHKQAELEVQMAQTEQLDVKWSAFENHIQKKRGRIERELQERIEAFRADMRMALRLTVESVTSELNVRTPPTELTDGALDQRNDLDTMLDSAKEEQLELLAAVEKEENDDSVDNNEALEDGITEIDDRDTEI